MLARLRTLVAATAVCGALLAPAGVAAAAPSTGEQLTPARALDWINAHPVPAASVIDNIETANAILKQLGITPFTPTVGACTDLTFPLAIGGAVPGPYTPGFGDLSAGNIDLNAVRKGEILYGFVPTGITDESSNKSGMRVAWLNTSTLKGDIGAPMSGLTDTILDAVKKRAADAGIPAVVVNALLDRTLKPALNQIPQGGVRGGLVETGSGTVLSAIYGTVQRQNATCFFFPSLGIATAG